MKSLLTSMFLVCALALTSSVSAQINLGKKIKDRAVQRTDQGIDKGLDAAEKDIKGENKDDKAKTDDAAKKEAENPSDANKESVKTDTLKKEQPALQTYSKYDFIAGEKVIFYDDFSQDAVGDFPVLWNTDGSGEVVTTNLYPGNWFSITNARSAVTLLEPLDLPENYTIEFDVIPQKDPNNFNDSKFYFYLISTPQPKNIGYGGSRPGATGICFDFAYSNYYSTYYADGSPTLDGNTQEFKLVVDKKYRISIWVQKERIRLYVDENKLWDLPKAMSKNYKYNMIRFQDGRPMFTNIRVAVGRPDMRSKLITEGKLVTYGIYFDVNKDVVKPESYGTLKEISKVLTENPDVRVKIIGHTDSDGADAANLDLSKRRAASVKDELSKNFGIDASRMETDGMGETQPVAPNDTPSNKALNRRVEFVKL
ncbi:MAG: OmpA family protein [Bacteroidetes bacterium]|nr:OmpA family protein [Bacteroidota bacterium]